MRGYLFVASMVFTVYCLVKLLFILPVDLYNIVMEFVYNVKKGMNS